MLITLTSPLHNVYKYQIIILHCSPPIHTITVGQIKIKLNYKERTARIHGPSFQLITVFLFALVRPPPPVDAP